MESFYIHEFMTLAMVHFLAVIIPGADFAMVVRQSLAYGRKIGVWTSIGIGTGMILHFTYTLLGLGLVISKSILLFNIIKYLGALYLVYLGVNSLSSKRSDVKIDGDEMATGSEPVSSGRAFCSGFLVNALNPKATLFFLSIFSVIVSPQTPIPYQIGYCLWIFIVQILWFSGISLFFSHQMVQGFFKQFGHWVERTMGAVLVFLGIRLALAGNK